MDPDSPQIQEAFLVHKSGCLIAYSSRKAESEKDYDIFAGMFTAIQSFVRDTFGAGQWSLKRLEFEDRNIVIELGDFLYLAIIYSGRADTKMQNKIESTIDHIEEDYWNTGKDWNGDMDMWTGVREKLKPLFSEDDGDLIDDRRRCQLCNSVIEELDRLCPVCGFDFALMG
jgi:hypothetical protein